MKQIEKQSMRELIDYALSMPVNELQKYGTMFLSGPVPEKMSRGELIALQLVERACIGDLEATKELRQWILVDPDKAKTGATGGNTYYQFLVQLSGKEPPKTIPAEMVGGLAHIAKQIDREVKAKESADLMDDLL